MLATSLDQLSDNTPTFVALIPVENQLGALQVRKHCILLKLTREVHDNFRVVWIQRISLDIELYFQSTFYSHPGLKIQILS